MCHFESLSQTKAVINNGAVDSGIYMEVFVGFLALDARLYLDLHSLVYQFVKGNDCD